MERPMLTAIALSLLGGAILGGGGALLATKGDRANKHDADIAQADADEAEAIASAAPATVEASAVLVAEVQAEDVTDADTRQAIATADAPTVAVLAAVEPDASSTTIALASYLGCIAGSQGKGEGSSAYDCQGRGKVLDEAIRARVVVEGQERADGVGVE